MVRNSNPNRKPIAGNLELSGAAKVRKRKLDILQSKKVAATAAKFFKASPGASSQNSLYSFNENVGEERENSNCIRVHADLRIENTNKTKCLPPVPAETSETTVTSQHSLPVSAGSSESTVNTTNATQYHVAASQLDHQHEEDGDNYDFKEHDPSSWRKPLSAFQHSIILNKGPIQVQLSNYPKHGRHAFNPKNMISPNGMRRDWIVYSESTNSLFCFPCMLFPGKSSSTSTWTRFGNKQTGFKNFGNQVAGIKQHEQSEAHFEATIAWREYEKIRSSGRTLDHVAAKRHLEEVSFWRQVLRGLLDAIIFLAKNNLAYLGSSFNIGDPGCGNFLSLVELLSKYYSPLAVHVSRIKSKESKISYMSPKIQNEFIDIVAQSVRDNILELVRERKYFAILFDATPDVAHQEQISNVVRYVEVSEKGCSIQEHFLGFVHFDLKTGLEISQLILNEIKKNGLDIMNCRGQGYDNGSNMSGMCKGVQARIKEVNPQAVFLPCAAHSLNLVGQNATTKILAGKLLGQIQNLYSFFSSSPFRWNTLRKHTKLTLKGQSSTRWSSKAIAVSALVEEFEGIVESLSELINSEESNAHTVAEANAHLNLILNFKFLLGSTIWNLILDRINVTNKVLQTRDSTIHAAAGHLEGLILWIHEFQQVGFERAIDVAKPIAEACGIHQESGFDTRVTRGRKPTRFRLDNEAEQENIPVIEKFKIEFFDAVILQLLNEFEHRFKTIDNLKEKIEFLWGSTLANSSQEELMNSAKSLADVYKGDLIKA